MIEIPGYIFCILVMDCWGRRPILSFCQVINGGPPSVVQQMILVIQILLFLLNDDNNQYDV